MESDVLIELSVNLAGFWVTKNAASAWASSAMTTKCTTSTGSRRGSDWMIAGRSHWIIYCPATSMGTSPDVKLYSVALLLAPSVAQLQFTPWLRTSSTKEDILFFPCEDDDCSIPYHERFIRQDFLFHHPATSKAEANDCNFFTLGIAATSFFQTGETAANCEATAIFGTNVVSPSYTSMRISSTSVRCPKLDELRTGSEKEIEYPFCFRKRKFKNERVWRQHILFDLRSYICTSPDCDAPYFGGVNEWFCHEMQIHRVSYTRRFCQTRTFSSERVTLLTFGNNIQTGWKILTRNSVLLLPENYLIRYLLRIAHAVRSGLIVSRTGQQSLVCLLTPLNTSSVSPQPTSNATSLLT